MIYNNWPLDARLDYKLVDGDKLTKKIEAKDTLLEENEDLLENVGYFLLFYLWSYIRFEIQLIATNPSKGWIVGEFSST